MRDSLGPDGCSHNRRSIVDGFHHLSLHSCPIPQRHHHDPAFSVQTVKLLLRYKALDNNTVARLLQGPYFLRHLRAHHHKLWRLLPGRLHLPANLRINLLGKPQHRICVRRMGKAAHKQKPLPFCKVLLQILLKLVKHISRNILYGNGGIHGPDGVPLHIRGVIGHGRLAHQRQLN